MCVPSVYYPFMKNRIKIMSSPGQASRRPLVASERKPGLAEPPQCLQHARPVRQIVAPCCSVLQRVAPCCAQKFSRARCNTSLFPAHRNYCNWTMPPKTGIFRNFLKC